MVFLNKVFQSAVLCTLLIFVNGCASIVTQPSSQIYSDPQKVVFQKPQSLWVNVDHDVKLHAWWFRAKNQMSKAVVIQFHGNAENMTSHYQSVAWMLNHGLDVITFDYRGYGQSGGKAKLKKIMNDAPKVLDFVAHLYTMQEKPIWLYGQSLGSLISAQAMAQNKKVKVSGWIIEGGIDSLTGVGQNVLAQHWLTWPFQPISHVLLPSKYNMKRALKQIEKLPPVLMLHSVEDPVVSINQSRKLKKRLPGKTCMIEVKEKTHINIGNVANGKYRNAILAFIDSQKCKKP